MHELIGEVFLKFLGNPILNKLTDAASVNLRSKRAVFSTDSFVVKPLFFPKADIGKLAIAGTVNDLLMLGAVPKYISLSFILQEDFPFSLLEKILSSIASAAKKAGVVVVTGDTKVVDRASCDGIFINTSGIGEKLPLVDLDYSRIKENDAVLINGYIGQHGVAIISARENLGFNVRSDCESLEGLVIPVLKEFKKEIHFLRDPTRGGLATTLNEVALKSGFGIVVDEQEIPISDDVDYACQILGLEPLYMACEGKAVFIVNKKIAPSLLKFLRKTGLGRKAKIFGKIQKVPAKKVIAKTEVGTFRIVDMQDGEPLPRIC